jgi:hypothetical protein
MKAAFWGGGVRKSCAHTIGVGRWTERYMDDAHVAVQACQEPVKSNGVWPEQADLQAIRERRATLPRFVSVSVSVSVSSAAAERWVSNNRSLQNSDNSLRTSKRTALRNLAYFPYLFRTRGLFDISGGSVLFVSLNSLPSDWISWILTLPLCLYRLSQLCTFRFRTISDILDGNTSQPNVQIGDGKKVR